jgi:branched-chain amino acid transport system ATP-binding protein
VIARAGIAFCPEERAIFSSLDVKENLLAAAAGAPRRPRPRSHLRAVSRICANGCGARAPNSPAASSRCWRSPVSCAPARGCCLLDEPTEGLAPVIIQQIGQTIGTLKAQGFTILLVEQNFNFAATVADRYYVMEHGRIVDQFSTPELKANMGKLHDYLGV